MLSADSRGSSRNDCLRGDDDLLIIVVLLKWLCTLLPWSLSNNTLLSHISFHRIPSSTTQQQVSMSDTSNYFKYDPNITLTYVGCAGFGLVTLFFLIQVFRFKAWYFLPFLLGCVFETIGYGMRRLAADRVDVLGLYIGQGLLLLLPPGFFSATIYMLLKKVILCMGAQNYSRLSLRWLTKIFVAADCFSLFLQAAGGGLQGAKKRNMTKIGQWTTIFGLIVQVIAFSAFLYLTRTFDVALQSDPASPANRVSTTAQHRKWAPWQQCLGAIYVSGCLILVRSVYRVLEYAMGHDGYLMVHEVFFYALDTLPMFLTTLTFIVVFPPAKLRMQAKLQEDSDVVEASRGKESV